MNRLLASTAIVAAALGCALALSLALPAFAQNTVPTRIVALQVPVRLTNYPSTRAAVWCELRDAAGKGMAVAMNYVFVLNNSPNVSATVDVGLKLPAAAAPNVRGWRCILATTDALNPDPRHVQGTAIPSQLLPLAEVSGAL